MYVLLACTAPASVTIAIRPLWWGGIRKVLDVILGSAKTEIFLKMGLDGGINGLRRCSNHAARGAGWPDGRRAGITVTVHLIHVCL
jgi:hypothetical protein